MPRPWSVLDAKGFLAQGRLREAETALRSVLAASPSDYEALYLFGVCNLQNRHTDEARRLIELAVEVRPDSTESLSLLAFILMKLNNPAQAMQACDRVLALDGKNVGAWITRGNALIAEKRHHDALLSLDQALNLDAGNPEALIARGALLTVLDRTEEAIESFERLPVQGNPTNLLRRAQLLESLGLLSAAIRDYRQMTELLPNDIVGWVGLLNCAAESCDWGLSAEAEKRVLRAVAAGQPVNPVLVMRLDTDPVTQAKAVDNAMARQPRIDTLSRPAAEVRSSRIRLAYVSPDFRTNPTAYALVELFEKHDRSRFELIGVSLAPDDGSDISARVRRAFETVHNVHADSDDDIVSLLRRENVDIAVDLAGHVQYARPGVFAQRVAPVQVSYFALGLSNVDYVLADGIVLPPEEQSVHRATVVYLPDTFWFFDSTEMIPSRRLSRTDHGLPEAGFVFCCFNKNYKVTEPVFDIWLRLLRAVDGSVLWLSRNRGSGCDHLRAYTESQGVDPARLIFAPNTPSREEYFQRYRLANLFLNTLPYQGHTIVSDALNAGLPVVNCHGRSFVGRVATSILHGAGLDELSVQDFRSYEALALELARSPSRLDAVKRKLVSARSTAPLFNIDARRRHLEAAYEEMLDIFRKGERPRGFHAGASAE